MLWFFTYKTSSRFILDPCTHRTRYKCDELIYTDRRIPEPVKA